MSFTDDEIRDLYLRYAPVLLRRSRSILRDEEEAHDVVQETFVRVLRHSAAFRQQASPLTWMYRISTNLCLNTLRDGSSRREKLTLHTDALAPPAIETRSTLDQEHIRSLLSEVDEQTRQVVVHLYFDECTRRETADLVGISTPTVRKRLGTFLDLARSRLGVVASLLWTLSLSGAP